MNRDTFVKDIAIVLYISTTLQASPGNTLGGVMPAPDLGPGLSKSVLLGACGMPGNTAYFGLLELCDPKPGETGGWRSTSVLLSAEL